LASTALNLASGTLDLDLLPAALRSFSNRPAEPLNGPLAAFTSSATYPIAHHGKTCLALPLFFATAEIKDNPHNFGEFRPPPTVFHTAHASSHLLTLFNQLPIPDNAAKAHNNPFLFLPGRTRQPQRPLPSPHEPIGINQQRTCMINRSGVTGLQLTPSVSHTPTQLADHTCLALSLNVPRYRPLPVSTPLPSRQTVHPACVGTYP
ncbi:hypothetical protein PTTG_10773, partial [Puccinia triticina 1-1 BBBD Race 1]